MTTKIFTEKLIAPCGINCAVCRAHLREKNKCPGCNFPDDQKPKTRYVCKIKNCVERKGEFCSSCTQFPCENLKKLDKRYREKYNMSEIANLELIRDKGITALLDSEEKKRISEKGVLCIHDGKHY